MHIQVWDVSDPFRFRVVPQSPAALGVVHEAQFGLVTVNLRALGFAPQLKTAAAAFDPAGMGRFRSVRTGKLAQTQLATRRHILAKVKSPFNRVTEGSLAPLHTFNLQKILIIRDGINAPIVAYWLNK